MSLNDISRFSWTPEKSFEMYVSHLSKIYFRSREMVSSARTISRATREEGGLFSFFKLDHISAGLNFAFFSRSMFFCFLKFLSAWRNVLSKCFWAILKSSLSCAFLVWSAWELTLKDTNVFSTLHVAFQRSSRSAFQNGWLF